MTVSRSERLSCTTKTSSKGGKALGARDFLEGALVLEQGVELFQECILSKQTSPNKIKHIHPQDLG
jgi:hypothetical protein